LIDGDIDKYKYIFHSLTPQARRDFNRAAPLLPAPAPRRNDIYIDRYVYIQINVYRDI